MRCTAAHYVVACSLLALASNCLAAGEESLERSLKSLSASVSKESAAPSSPEDSVRNFLLAMLERNEKELRKWSLPHKDWDILLAGNRPPQEALKQIKSAFKNIPIKRLKVGDRVALPGGRTMTVDESRVNENWRLLQLENDPLPWTLVNKEGEWKVDPSPIIAARKAAAAARQSR